MNTKMTVASLFATLLLAACAAPGADEGDFDGEFTADGTEAEAGSEDVGQVTSAATTCTLRSPTSVPNPKYRGCYFENTRSYWKNAGTNCSLIIVSQNGGNFACNAPAHTTKLLGSAADISNAYFAGGGVCASNHAVGSCWSL